MKWGSGPGVGGGQPKRLPSSCDCVTRLEPRTFCCIDNEYVCKICGNELDPMSRAFLEISSLGYKAQLPKSMDFLEPDDEQ